MKRVSRYLLPLLFVTLAAPAARAATTGTADVTLAAAAHAMIQILDASLVLTPTPTDYDNDLVEATGASGLRVRVKTNSSTGMALLVRCADATPQIALADLLFKTQTASPTGGWTIASWTPITAVNQTLWTTSAAQHPWLNVTTDVRVQNLGNYDDAAAAGTTAYTNTLTYTVITQ
jgi:hypothetical protein